MANLFSRNETINKVVLLSVESIVSNPAQPRKVFHQNDLEQLAQSIQNNGLLQPVTVRRLVNGQFELVAGERRLLACRLLRMERIPAIIQDIDSQHSAIFALIENLQRQDLNFFEEAEAIQSLIQAWNLSQQEVSKRLGKAQSTVANKLRLLQLDKELRETVLNASLTERHARALLKISDRSLCIRALEHIISAELNVQQAEEYIEGLITKPQKQKASRILVIKDIRIFFNTISKAVNTMKLAGIQVDTTQQEDDEFIHYTVKIPKSKAYKRSFTA